MKSLETNIEQYILEYSDEESVLRQKINRETNLKVLKPRMLSGHIQGNILALFSRMIRPRRILEIGTFTGYSALCLAEGLTEEGILHTIEVNEELEEQVQKYFSESVYSDKIKLHIGCATEIIPKLNEKYDLVFIDADKGNYAKYFDLVIDNVRSGGFIIADNVLWSGKILDETKTDKSTLAIKAFNNKIKNNENVYATIMPIRDGLYVICKK